MAAGSTKYSGDAGQETLFEKANLGGIQVVFLIAMTLGLEAIVEGVYRYFISFIGLDKAVETRASIWFFAPVVAMLLLGLRFFWAVVNIRRYTENVSIELKNEADETRAIQIRERGSRAIVMVHMPILILHGFLYYTGARLVSDMLFSENAKHTVPVFIVFYSIFQLVNVGWVWLLIRRFKGHLKFSFHRETVWMTNNFVTSLLGLGLLIPFYLSVLSLEQTLFLACLVFIASSFVDLFKTAYHYLEGPER